MDKRLHRLETLRLRGSDGEEHVVYGYEHLVFTGGLPEFDTSWEPTGQVEYKLAEGDRVVVAADGTMSVPRRGLTLAPREAAQPG